jgi:hypothetical protein
MHYICNINGLGPCTTFLEMLLRSQLDPFMSEGAVPANNDEKDYLVKWVTNKASEMDQVFFPIGGV